MLQPGSSVVHAVLRAEGSECVESCAVPACGSVCCCSSSLLFRSLHILLTFQWWEVLMNHRLQHQQRLPTSIPAYPERILLFMVLVYQHSMQRRQNSSCCDNGEISNETHETAENLCDVPNIVLT
jgi:hypothetical protein